MANYSFSRLERAYLQLQPTFGVIPNSSGTATVANANACRCMHMELQNDVILLERPDKTGTRSQEGMIAGRKMGRWSIELAQAANGTPGVVPDCDPILVAAFGQAATVGSGTQTITSSTDATPIVMTASGATGVTSGTMEMVTISGHTVNTNANGSWLAYANSSSSLTLIGSSGNGLGAGSGGTVSRVKLSYTFVDAITHFTLWSFRMGSNLDQRVAHTCVVSEMSFNLNQDVATWSANGDCMWVLRSKDYAIADVYQLGGMTGGFPTEPASPVTNGGIIPGFTGRFVAGASSSTASVYAAAAVTFTTIKSVSIRVQTSNLLVRDNFGSYYSTLTEGDVRHVSLSYNIYDDDSAAVNTMKTWGDSKTPVDFVINNGTVFGNTWIHYLKNVYLASHVLSDGQLRFEASYADSRATTSNLGVRDEYSLTIC
jgi:hypothetical protein